MVAHQTRYWGSTQGLYSYLYRAPRKKTEYFCHGRPLEIIAIMKLIRHRTETTCFVSTATVTKTRDDTNNIFRNRKIPGV